jgi:hypothetical protein
MSVLVSRLDPASATYGANRSANLDLLEELDEQLARAGRVGRALCACYQYSVSRCRPATPGEVKGTGSFGVFRM